MNSWDLKKYMNNNLRYNFLDDLRGIAALAVFMQHLLGHIYHTIQEFHPLYKSVYFLLAETVDWGRFGVVLFFLVSGFIIPSSLNKSSILTFIIGRFFRLYPAYCGSHFYNNCYFTPPARSSNLFNKTDHCKPHNDTKTIR